MGLPPYPIPALELSSPKLLALMFGHAYKAEKPGFGGKGGIPEEWGSGVCVPPLLGCESLGSRRESRATAKTHPQAFGAYTVNHSYCTVC